MFTFFMLNDYGSPQGFEIDARTNDKEVTD